ncbi:MAG: hypothetical protein C0613_09070 [Desulfobulbaceae bacterium]|nr:MAG: hypothetical protein C0613_09070 [Desulfobulbaceae bacterium]
MLHLPPALNRAIGQALHEYRMLSDGDQVLVAVSGGVDSLVLAAILRLWRQKAPISYGLSAVYLDMGFDKDEGRRVGRQLEVTGVPFQVIRTSIGKDALAHTSTSTCFHCARNRRTALFNLARDMGCNKLALGHHKEDIIETFFLNLFYGGNLSTMLPKQELFKGNLAIIRPLAFLQKQEITELAELFGFAPVANPCPLTGSTKRQSIRTMMNTLYRQDPGLQSTIFAALGNVKPEYLLDQRLHGREARP